MLYWTVAFLVGILAMATVIPMLKLKVWWVRDFDFPRLQLSFLALVLFIAAIFIVDYGNPKAWVLLVVSGLCLVYQGWWVIPYTIFYPKEVKANADFHAVESLKILVSNVLTPNKRAHDLLRLVKENDPHVLVVVETDKWWESQLDSLEKDYPHSLKCPLDNLYGMHVYSKLPLEDAEIQFLVEDDVPSMHTLLVMPSGLKIRLHCLHPAPPSPTENETSSERDAELVIVAKNVAVATLPVIVTGDLNDVAWSKTTRLFRKISGLLDPRVGRGMFSTFHAKYTLLRWPLDHFFHSKHFILKDLKRLDYIGSDHFPMFIELGYEPAQGADQDGIHADEEDEAEAEENSMEEGVSKNDVHQPGE